MQGFSGANQKRFKSLNTDAQRISGLFIAELFVKAEDKGRTLTVRECINRSTDAVRLFASLESGFGVVSAIIWLRYFLQRGESSLALMIDAEVKYDPVKPG